MRNSRLLLLLLLAALVASRLCHTRILWEGDTYPLAAAQQMEHGKALYREIWFDKPPVLPAVYLLWGAQDGVPLRLAGALYAWLVCLLAYAFARDRWSAKEGAWAAALAGFFLIFDFPSSAVPVASDLLMVAPHLAAVWMAWKRRPFLAGVLAGLAFWINPKGAFVALACVAWNPAGMVWMAAGVAAVSAAALAWLGATASVAAWWNEVWVWGRLYAGSTFVELPLTNGILRTLGWLGFHAAAVVAAGRFLLSRERKGAREIAWLVLAAAGVTLGLRFFPRYYFLLLPPVVVMAARGFVLLERKRAMLVAAMLVIPLVRFGPAYWTALHNETWRDTAMDRDSRAAAALVRKIAKPGDTLLVWGYRPELYVYTSLPAATLYIDTQVLTGVPADRHLTDSRPVETVEAARRRGDLAGSRPTFVIDGIGPYNASLAVTAYPELRGWLAVYEEVGRTGGTVLYRRK